MLLSFCPPSLPLAWIASLVLPLVALPAGARPSSSAQLGACAADWIPTFGDSPSFDGAVNSSIVFDDGSGPALYLAGAFTRVAGVAANRIVKWDGSSWSALGNGLSLDALDLAAFDDGSGPALYVAHGNRISKWDGSSWAAVTSAVAGGTWALAVFDDGSGPALYAGGEMTSIDGVPVGRIARWDGASWSDVGGGVNSLVNALQVFDDGSGPALYAAGFFTDAGGAPASRIAKWDGATWSALGSGLDGLPRALEVFDDGSGAALYVGGTFYNAGGAPASHAAKWNGSAWSALGAGTNEGIWSLQVFDAGGGPALYAGGLFTEAGGAQARGVARWGGSTWSALGIGLDGDVTELAAFDVGGVPMLHAVGSFVTADDLAVNGFAGYDGSSWSANWSLEETLNGMVRAATAFDDGGGLALYVGGDFSHAGTARVNHIAKWDGAAWSDLAGGLASGTVYALAVFDDGTGEALYAAGSFQSIGGIAADNIARWDGSSWSPLGLGLSGLPKALITFDDGTGEALYVGGRILEAGGSLAQGVARWDGASWSAMPGLPSGPWLEGVEALAVFDDGTGPALHAGGTFTTVNGLLPGGLARWDGAGWSQVGGVQVNTYSLAVFDDGNGAALYVGSSVPTVGANGIARWSGASWSAVGSGLGGAVLHSLVAHDDGNGPALYAGGYAISGGVRKWDGASWSGLGAVLGTVDTLATFDGGGPPVLVVGGLQTSPVGERYLSLWGCPPEVGTAYCFGHAAACPCANAGGAGEGCANSTGAGALLSGHGSASVAADSLSLEASRLPAFTFALLFGADDALNGGRGFAFGGGLLCAGGNALRLGMRASGAGGTASWGPGIAGQGGYAAGRTVRFQVYYRDTAGSPCSSGFNLSNGLEIAFH